MKPVFPLDKANHFIFGYLIYFFAFMLVGTYYATIPVIFAAVGKEVYDVITRKLSFRKFDYADCAYTIAGCIPAFAMNIA